MTHETRIRLHTGIPEGQSGSPTCGACAKQIERGTVYASVPSTPGYRETRHNTESCLRWEVGNASALTVGMIVITHRYMLCEWGGRIEGVIAERTEEFNEHGWRAYLIAPLDPEDTSVIDRFRNHPEEFFRKLAKTLVFDPQPRKVYISDKELIHYRTAA